MKKNIAFLLCTMAIFGCSKHDPILPGVRHEIFDSGDVAVADKNIPELSSTEKNIYGDANCDCRQDATNSIWRGDKKVYTGFAGNTIVKTNQTPICVDNFVYTGLSNGSVIKLNKNNKRVVWQSDVYKDNVFTGGSAIVDIIARVGYDNGYIYAGGLGDAFCKLNANTGNKVWCVGISVPVDFIIVDNFAFVVGGDNNLYSINTKDGTVYWKSEVKKQIKPKYDGKKITVGKQKINYTDGSVAK